MVEDDNNFDRPTTAHPDLVPMWDTLAVTEDGRGHTWTVHMPEVPRQLFTKRSQS